jgi:hypothetical protein
MPVADRQRATWPPGVVLSSQLLGKGGNICRHGHRGRAKHRQQQHRVLRSHPRVVMHTQATYDRGIWLDAAYRRATCRLTKTGADPRCICATQQNTWTRTQAHTHTRIHKGSSPHTCPTRHKPWLAHTHQHQPNNTRPKGPATHLARPKFHRPLRGLPPSPRATIAGCEAGQSFSAWNHAGTQTQVPRKPKIQLRDLCNATTHARQQQHLHSNNTRPVGPATHLAGTKLLQSTGGAASYVLWDHSWV